MGRRAAGGFAEEGAVAVVLDELAEEGSESIWEGRQVREESRKREGGWERRDRRWW